MQKISQIEKAAQGDFKVDGLSQKVLETRTGVAQLEIS